VKLYTKILIGMLIGLLAGVLVGPQGAVVPRDVLYVGTQVIMTSDAPDAAPAPHCEDVERTRVQREESKGAFVESEACKGWVPLDGKDVTQRRASSIGESLVASTYWVGRLFLALLKMIVVPLVFCSLTLGVSSLGDPAKLGRLGARTLGMFLCTTVAALIIGVSLANLIGPGHYLDAADRARLLATFGADAAGKAAKATTSTGGWDQLIALVPTNPAAAIASDPVQMLPIIAFAILFGVALTRIDAAPRDAVRGVLRGIDDAMVVLVDAIMFLAPYGVAALLFKVAGTTGATVLTALLVYSLVVVLGLLTHLTLVYGGLLRFVARLPMLPFLQALRPALLTAFSTSSSSATLPVTKRCVERGVGVREETSSFVLPLGATVNMDGTALYQGIAAVFIAQIYGMDLTLAQQATVVVSATAASIGAAGVPGAGMITLTMVLTTIGVPLEGLALVLGVDRILDMFRTTVNVVGDSTVAASVARLEGETLEIRS
jgi:Na+/H+-dicarboxylate symporter